MKERRRGLGRGLGALIPTSSEGERPVDVFFPAAPSGAAQEASVATIERPASDLDPAPGDVSRETAADDHAPTDTTEGGEDATESAEGQPGVAPEDQPGADDQQAEHHAEPAGADETPADHSTGAATASAADVTTPAPDDSTGTDVGELADPASAQREAEAPEQEPSDTSEAPASAHAAEPATTGVDAVATDGLVPVPGASFAELPVSSIRANPRQPRTVFDEGELDELVGSIKEIGVLQPVVVRPVAEEAGRYELIMGERRWRATQAAGLEVIPAIIRVTDDEDLLRDALLENLHRSALNPLEEAAAYRQLLDDFGCTHDELALRISRSRPQISNTLRLLRLPPLVQRRVAAGVLSAGHARALLGLPDGAAIERLAQRIVSEGLSVRATEEIVALGVGDEKAPAHRPRAGQRSEAVDELATRLSDRFETRVRVDLGKSKGRVTIEFASVEDLNRILDVMAPEDPGLLRR